jgi:hypothetical protein
VQEASTSIPHQTFSAQTKGFLCKVWLSIRHHEELSSGEWMALETGIRDSSSPLGQRIHLAGVHIEAGAPGISTHRTTSLALLNSWFKLIHRGICGKVGRHEFLRDESKMGSMKAFQFSHTELNRLRRECDRDRAKTDSGNSLGTGH